MLRLHRFRYHRPRTLSEAVGLLDELGPDAMPIAGGTDLMPNMKHRLFTPAHLVSLSGIAEMKGVSYSLDRKTVRIGATETLTDVAANPLVRKHFSGLATAAGLVAGPQLRNMGTIGGNICLDTRCTYYNQSHFWRGALGGCLKIDGTVCHVTKVGAKCVAAHSADTPTALIALGASFTLVGPGGSRTVKAKDYFVADGIRNTRRTTGEILTGITVPVVEKRRSAYQKLRQRASIDFPLLSVGVAADFAADGTVTALTGVVSALGARPRMLSRWGELALGAQLNREVVDQLAERARAQCQPLENMIVDADWRRAMVPVYVRRALEGLG